MCAVGCWTSPATTDGFTAEQWRGLQQLALPELPELPDPCAAAGLTPVACDSAQSLAQRMFVDTTLSSNGTVSCATCHAATDAFIDPRTPNNVSLGATGWTKRNSKSLIDESYKLLLGQGKPVFTWIGQYTTPGAVLDLALNKAMGSTDEKLVTQIEADPTYSIMFEAAFGVEPSTLPEQTVFDDLTTAFTAYLGTIVAPPTTFDAFLRGNGSAISESAQRGLQVFVGRGTCLECHNGPLFSDLQCHNTGVPQEGADVVAVDVGCGSGTLNPADVGGFVTPSLREIGNTAPYMHDGVFMTLTDVIQFYNHADVDGPYSGTRDPRIGPLELSDQDVLDLQAFLMTLDSCSNPASCTFGVYGGATTP